MPDIRLVLRESRQETPTIRSFRFAPEPAFAWQPGQYLMMKLDVRDPRGAFRSFTIASSPTEGSVMIATRVVGRSPFKQALSAMEPGAAVTAKAPLGRFTLHEDPSLRAVFVAGGIGITPFRSMIRYATDAGGIGITPFRSMIRYATDAGLPVDLLLLYAARTEPEIAFREELDALQRENPRLRVVQALTRAEPGWTGPRGRIDGAFVKREAGSLERAVVYVAGRPSFVDDLRTGIMELGVPRERVRSEQFPGYE